MDQPALGVEKDFLLELAYSLPFESDGTFFGISLHTAQFVSGENVRMAIIGKDWTLGIGENGDSPLAFHGDLDKFKNDIALISLVEDSWRV